MARKVNPALEQREERAHKDLDGDNEKGESAAHCAKVLGSSKVTNVIGGPMKACKKCSKMHAPGHPHFK